MSELDFPRWVFKNVGVHARQGGTYSQLLASDEKNYLSALHNGWYATLIEAIVEKDQPSPVIEAIAVKIDERQKIEDEAKRLGLSFAASITDKKLQEKIDLIKTMRQGK